MEDFREVAECVALVVQSVRVFDEGDGFSGELLGVAEAAPVGVDERLHEPPVDLCDGVVFLPELAPEPGELFGLVVPPERAQRVAHV